MGIKATIRLKRESYKNLQRCKGIAFYKNYEAVKREAKKDVQGLNVRLMRNFIARWGMKDEEKYIYKL